MRLGWPGTRNRVHASRIFNDPPAETYKGTKVGIDSIGTNFPGRDCNIEGTHDQWLVTHRGLLITMDHVQFILLDISPSVIEAWTKALSQHIPDAIDKFSIVQSTLEDLASGPHQQFDCIVSPANSYGRLDGG